MRLAAFLMALAAVQAGVVSRDWADGKLTLHLSDGIEEIEWISEKACGNQECAGKAAIADITKANSNFSRGLAGGKNLG